MWPSDAPFQAGDEVQLTNLSKAHLNGARGVAVGYDAERGRISVRLVDGGPPLAVRPANLVKAAPLAAEEEGGATDDEAEHAAWLAALPQMTATQLGAELLEAARYGEEREVGELLAAKADVNHLDGGGNTALHRACANGHVAVVQQLAAAGAALLANESGNSPLHWAVQHASAPLVAAVLQAFPGADVLARNAFGKSVSTEAFARNVPEIVDAVLAHDSAAALDPEANAATPDALTSELTHSFLLPACGSGDPMVRLRCRELSSIGGDDPSAVIGATPNDDRTGLQIWSASLLLARWVCELRPRLRGRRVLELGAGCGLPGLAAAAAGAATTTITDLADHTMRNIEHNIDLNRSGGTGATRGEGAADATAVAGGAAAAAAAAAGGAAGGSAGGEEDWEAGGAAGGRMTAAVVDWGDAATWPSGAHIVLGSDLVYAREAVPQLLALLPALLPEGGGGAFYYVAPETDRLGEVEFLDGLVGLGWYRTEEAVPHRFMDNVLDGVADEDFRNLFPELATRTYTLYTFTRHPPPTQSASSLAAAVPLPGFAIAAAAAVRQPDHD